MFSVASDLHNSSCITGIKNKVHSAYNGEKRQLRENGPPTQLESTKSAEICLEVGFVVDNAN